MVIEEVMKETRFYDLTASRRLLYTCFLVLLGLGYLMALSQLYITHEKLDGKPGLSVADIADAYYLFGISLLLFFLGSIFIHAELNTSFKRVLVIVPMLSLFIDILVWFLTKWDPAYAWVVVSAGSMLGASMGMQIVISLYQICFLKRPVLK